MGISGVPLDKNQIINALHLKKGIIRHAAAHIACEPKTIYSWVDKDPEVANALKEALAPLTMRMDEKLAIDTSTDQSGKLIVNSLNRLNKIFDDYD